MADDTPLAGMVGLVARATRGAGRAIAVELARAGFFVYATGRSSRSAGPSEIGRPETIEETGDLICGRGRQRDGARGRPRGACFGCRAGRGHRARAGPTWISLVNDIFGGDRYMEWDKPLWEHDWARRACGCCRWACTRT